MIKDLVRGAIKGAAVWVGNTVAGPTGGAIGGKLADSLLNKKAGGGEFEPINTMVQPQSYGGKMGFASPGMAKKASSMSGLKTVDADTINAEWNYRLNRYLVTKRYYKT